MKEVQKSLRSGKPQAYYRKSSQTFSYPDYSTEIRVGKKVVGKVVGNEFIKEVHSTKHFLQKPRAIAFDLESLAQAQSLGATFVRIIDLDKSIVYRVNIELIYQKGFYFNRGWGNQVGLTLNHWQCDSNQVSESTSHESYLQRNTNPISPIERNSRNGFVQLNLFK